MVLLLREN